MVDGQEAEKGDINTHPPPPPCFSFLYLLSFESCWYHSGQLFLP